MQRLLNKTVVITGGAQGLGRALAIRAHKEGANVAIGDFNIEGAQQTVDMIDGAIAVNRRVERYTTTGQLLFATEIDPGLQYVDIQRPFELTSDGSIAYLRATETQLLVDLLDQG